MFLEGLEAVPMGGHTYDIKPFLRALGPFWRDIGP